MRFPSPRARTGARRPQEVDAPRGITRARLLRGGAAAGGAALAGAVAAGGVADVATSAPSREQDVRVLNFVLLLERLEQAFYDRARDTRGLRGDVAEYLRIVGGHERAHVALLERTLGSGARQAPRFDLAAATADPAAVLRSARILEDAVVSAYNGQAANLTKRALAPAARIASVESRHAAWIRALSGEAPAPDATDDARTEAQVRSSLADAGLLERG